ncbi:Rieske (2Fe-2S) protein [Chloroflexota bacterium]
MGEFIRLANTKDLTDGTMKNYQLQGTDIFIARIEGKYYTAQNKCPHFGGDLSSGKLEGTIVTCPRHGSQFNLTDGSVVRWLKESGLISIIGKNIKSPRALSTYKTKIEGQEILVEF